MLNQRQACLGWAAILSSLGTGAALGAPELSPEVLMHRAPAGSPAARLARPRRWT